MSKLYCREPCKTVKNVVLYPHHAIVVGAISGVASVLGHVWVTVIFESRLLT